MLLLTMLACGLPNVSFSWPTGTPPVNGPSETFQPELPPTQILPGPSPTTKASTPPPSIILPSGVIVAQSDNSSVTFLDTQGKIFGSVTTPGTGNLSQESIHVAGPVAGVWNNTPVVYSSNENGGELRMNVNGQISTLVSAANISSMLGVPGQSILSYSTAEFLANGLRSHSFVSPMDTLSYAGAAISLDDPEGWAVKPLAIHVVDGVPDGIWYTLRAWGIGGDIVFEPHRGLYYMNINDGTTSEIVSKDNSPSSLSFDHTWVAYTAGESSTSGLSIRNLTSGGRVTIPLLATSDRGAGDAVFSPDNQFVAWMEGSGSQMAEIPNFHPTIRIATMDGNVFAEYPDTALDSAAGFNVAWSEPVGWLDGQTVLLQVRGQDWVQTAVLKVNESGMITLMSNGVYCGLLYP